MRIFLIAPRGAGQADLDIEAEYAAFTSNHETVPEIPLLDSVLDRDIAYEVAKAGNCDMLAILAHADQTGIVLSDGNYLDAETIGQYARTLNAQYIYLNTCDSIHFVNRLAIVTTCTVIYTATQITDTEAIRFGTLFAAKLAESNDVDAAFRLAAPRNRRYRLHRPKTNAMTQDELRQFAELRAELNALHQEMVELKHTISDFVPVIRAEVNLLKERNEWHEKSDQSAGQQLHIVHFYGRVIAVIGLLIFIALLKGIAW